MQHNALRIQNGGWVIGAPQLVQDGQEYMANPAAAEHHRQDAKCTFFLLPTANEEPLFQLTIKMCTDLY